VDDNSGVLLRGDSEVTCGNLTEGEITKQQGKVEGKSSLIMALGLALTITGGAFAYTWTTGGLTIGIQEPTGDIATVNATETQPDWEDVLIPETDTIIYRPNATIFTTTMKRTGERICTKYPTTPLRLPVVT